MTHDGRRRAILAIDTATTRVVVATGTPGGVADGLSTWAAGYRHGETLLPSIGRFLGEQNIRRSRLVGIVVGTGPGAFTGLRVGIATAKGLAHGLGIPLVGVSTGEALIEAFQAAEGTDGPTVLLLPAGPSDRIVVRAGRGPCRCPPGRSPTSSRASASSPSTSRAAPPTRRSHAARRARAGLGQALLRAGARLAALAARPMRRAPCRDAAAPPPSSRPSSPTTSPSRVASAPPSGTVEWSRDPR